MLARLCEQQPLHRQHRLAEPSIHTDILDSTNEMLVHLSLGLEKLNIGCLQALTVQGNTITPSSSQSFSAIDTGTTLVGGPSSVIQSIFAQIPGSAPGSGNWQGYWTYPCNTQVNIAISFGGPSWPIAPADFQLTQLSSSQCIGAFFELSTGGSAPSWIVGDTFLVSAVVTCVV